MNINPDEKAFNEVVKKLEDCNISEDTMMRAIRWVAGQSFLPYMGERCQGIRIMLNFWMMTFGD